MKVLYSVIRYVPNNVRQEFINIGAIVSDGECNWRWKITENWERAARLNNDLVEAVRQYLDDVEPDVDAWLKEGGLIKLRSVWRNAVQLSEPLPMATDSLDQGLGWVMDRFVESASAV